MNEFVYGKGCLCEITSKVRRQNLGRQGKNVTRQQGRKKKLRTYFLNLAEQRKTMYAFPKEYSSATLLWRTFDLDPTLQGTTWESC